MPVTMSSAITEVRALLNETTAAFWTDAQLQSWVNQGCEDVARRAEILWNEVDIPITPNVQNYAFPADWLSAHRAEFSPTNSNQTYSCEFRAINSMDEIWGILHQLPAAWPQYFTIRGNNSGFFLMLYPAPGASGDLRVYYYRQAVVISNPTDFIDTLSGWEDTVYDYAVFKALRASKDATWEQAFQIYESKLAQMKDTTRNFTDLGNVVTSGIANWPTYTYADNGGW